MKGRSTHIFFAICIVIISLFMGIGYAVFNSVTLDLDGVVNIASNKSIFISNAETFDLINATGNVNLYEGTYFDSTVKLDNINNIDNTSASFSITIKNNTADNYAYVGTSFIVGPDTYDNSNITFEIINMVENDVIESGMSKTFVIKFTFGYPLNLMNDTLNSKINFNFKNLSGTKLNALIIANENANNSGLYDYNNMYYYGGSSVNNYIWFNCDDGYNSGDEYCERWRIISIEEDGSLKIIKDSVVGVNQITELETATNFWLNVTNSTWVRDSKILAQGKAIFDYKQIRPINADLENSYCLRTSNGCNAYSSSQNSVGSYLNQVVDEDSMIKKYLDTVYYTYGLSNSAKEAIKQHTYNIGLVNTGQNIDNVVIAEKSITTNSYVALSTVSDHIFASNDNLCKQEFNKYINSNCKTNNWMVISDLQYILLNGKPVPANELRQQIWTLKQGTLVSQDASNEYYLRPVVTLKENKTGLGSGTVDEPYTIIN